MVWEDYDIYFSLAFFFSLLYHKSNTKTYLMIAKYFNYFGAFVWAEDASSKVLRGNIFQINYTNNNQKCYVFLPYSNPPKKWIKVTAIIRNPNNPEQVKEFDVTKAIKKICGPGKDFFNVNITLKQINKKWEKLTFHYKKKQTVSFNPESIINGL